MSYDFSVNTRGVGEVPNPPTPYNKWLWRQLQYWSAYEEYSREYWSNPQKVAEYYMSQGYSKSEAQKLAEEWIRESYRPPDWYKWLYHSTEALNYVLGMTGLNPISGYVAQYLHEHEKEAGVGTNPVTNVLTNVYPYTPFGAAQTAERNVVVNVQSALGNAGKTIQDAFKWAAEQLGRWGPVVLLVIILYLLVRLIRG